MKRSLLPVLALSILAGCAGQNATSDYADVEKAVGTPTGLPHVKQSVPTKVGFKVVVESDAGLVFTAGQESTYQVRTEVVEGLKYSVQLSDAPKGMKLESTDQEGVYRLTWKPTADQVAFGLAQDQFRVRFNLKYDVKNSTPESVLVFKSQSEGGQSQKAFHQETVSVKRVMQQPTIKIVDTTPVPATVNEGESFKLTLEVTDVAADEKNPPRLTASKVSGIDGAAFIRDELKSQGLKQTKPGVWTATRVFTADLSNLSEQVKKDQKIGEASASFPVQFGFEVYSPNSLQAATQVRTVTVQLDKNFEAPKLKLGLPRGNTLKRGTKNTITIIAESLNKRANVVIDSEKLKQSLSSLPSNPVLDCPEKKSTYLQTCTVTVEVDCSAPDLQSEYTFTVEAGSTLFGETKVSKQDQVVKLAPVCPKKAPNKKAGST